MKFCTVLISTGKCGSNTLIQSIKDTFNIDIYKPFDIELNSEIHDIVLPPEIRATL